VPRTHDVATLHPCMAPVPYAGDKCQCSAPVHDERAYKVLVSVTDNNVWCLHLGRVLMPKACTRCLLNRLCVMPEQGINQALSPESWSLPTLVVGEA
jgi:hypothetical protein